VGIRSKGVGVVSKGSIVSRLYVIGLGLIGASISSAALRSGVFAEVVGYDYLSTSGEWAEKHGVCNRAERRFEAILAEISSDDIMLVAVPSLAYKTVFERIGSSIEKGFVLTDAASVKGSVIEAAKQVWNRVPSGFVGGHPIAGSEKSGVMAANPDLFQGRRAILTPSDHTDESAVERVKSLWQNLGSEVVIMSVQEHDRVLAATSHLPHAIAYSLVDTLANDANSEDIFRYAAGGFKDFTRIASSDPTMWHDIMIANRESVLEALDMFRGNLDRLYEAVETGDSHSITSIFTRAREAREEFLLNHDKLK